MTNWKALLVVIGLGLSIMVLSPCSSKSAEIGQVQAKGATCDGSIKDMAAIAIRLDQLKEMYEKTPGEHARLVLSTEIKSLLVLNQKIVMWGVENCRSAKNDIKSYNTTKEIKYVEELSKVSITRIRNRYSS